jgi:hypothetical protein
MSKYGNDKKKEHLAMIRRAMVVNPQASGQQITDLLKKRGHNFGKNYVYAMIKRVRGERATRYDRKTKAIVVAEFHDFIEQLEPRLREIALSIDDERAAVQAIKTLVENKKLLIDMAMDLGLIERQLGTVNVNNFDMAALSKIAEDASRKRKKDNNGGNDIEIVDEQ